MEKNKTLELIRDISNAPGVSGFEDEVLAVIRRYGAGLGQWSEDSLRNLYLRRAGSQDGSPMVMLDAHSDEIGFMVKAIRPNGMLTFIPLGGWVASAVSAHRVLVRNNRGAWLPGIIATKPPHFMSEAERKQPPEIADMVIDLGASSDAEVREDFHISVGAPVVPDVSFECLDDGDRGIMIGKALDNRLGCAAVVAALSALDGAPLGVNVTAAFAAQEEVGRRGATVTARTVQPDVAIVFEGAPADDTAVEAYAVQAALRKGPTLRHFDTGMITSPRFQSFALDVAREKNIPVQESVRSSGSTNSGAIHLSGKGVPTIVIAAPVRYVHTHYGMAAYSDFAHCVELACQILRRLDGNVIAGF
ncbi:MAG: M20/M25/M40 family metallo-hydrolase [Treponema sp.]|nr:M20/M25/M40 family metallo-hydrolase [Treponema sp.]